MTAVEWLEKQLIDAPYIHFGDLFEQAREMEKQQIEISDDDIEKFASDFYNDNGSESIFILGAKWYRQQLKNSRNG